MQGGWAAKGNTVHFFQNGKRVSVCGKKRKLGGWLFPKSDVLSYNVGRRHNGQEEYRFCVECRQQVEEV